MDQLQDSRLVEFAQAGDQQAFAELYRRHFDAVYDFAARLTRSRHEAGSIAQETFQKAMDTLGGLHGVTSFQSWIFTIARNTALNRLERAARTGPVAFEDDEADGVPFVLLVADGFADPDAATEANVIGSLVWEAAAGLDPRQVSLLDLHLRQGLESGEIANVLGVTTNNGNVLLNRLKRAVENSLSAFIIWKDGRRHCEELNAALVAADIRGISPELRKAVDRHVTQCTACEERRKNLAPLAAFAGLGRIRAPGDVKAHILDRLLERWPGPAATHFGGFGDDGGGVGATGRGAGRSGGMSFGRGSFVKVGAALGLLAAALFALLFFPASPIALTRNDGSNPPSDDGVARPDGVAASATRTPTTATSPAFVSPSPQPSRSATAAGSATVASTVSTATNTPAPTPGPGTPTNTPTRTAIPTATFTNTPAPVATATSTSTITSTPCVPTIARFASGPLTVAPGGSTTFTVSNTQGCSASYSVAPDPAAPWLIVTGGGTLAAFEQTAVGVRVDSALLPAAENTYTGNLTVTGPNNAFVVQVRTTIGGGSPNVTLTSSSCGGSSVDFVAHATDDIGVTAVTVTYTLSTGAETSRVMNLNPGDSPTNGNWHTAFNLAPPTSVVSFTITATDGGFRTGSVSGSC